MDTSMSVNEIKRQINSVKISINSLDNVIQKDSNCSNWQNLKDLIDGIDKDTTTLIGQQYFILFDFFFNGIESVTINSNNLEFSIFS